MLQPKKTKFRKAFKGRIHGLAKGVTSLNFGSYGLKAMEPERITARQIEAARRAISRAIKRQGRLWIRIFPDVPVSSKPAEVRMGKGKGSPEYWVPRQARPHPVRTRRRSRPRGRAGVRTCGDEAADQDEGRCPPRRHLAPGGLRAMAKTEDLTKKTDDQLAEQLGELKREAFNLRFQAATGQLEKASRVKEVRRTIARIKTEQTGRTRSAAK